MGKYSKPQKSNKHKKIKFVDPFYHGVRKERMHAGKNLTPKYTEQGTSRSMKDLIRRTQLAKEMNNKSRRGKRDILAKKMVASLSTEGAEREMSEIPVFKQKKGEKNDTFLRRIDSTTKDTIKESQIEAKLPLEKDPVLDKVEEKSTKKKERLKSKKQLKKQKQQEKKADREDDFIKFQDKVEFGEIVHGPPALKSTPKYCSKTDKPSVKSLLLYEVMKKNTMTEEDADKTDHSPKTPAVKPPKTTGKGTKRKLLSPADQRKMDRERLNAIAMYRQYKKTAAAAASAAAT